MIGVWSSATREGSPFDSPDGSFWKLSLQWQPHDTMATTGMVKFECYTTVHPWDTEQSAVMNAFAECLSDLIEAFSSEVGNEVEAVKASLLRKLQQSAG